MLDSVWEGVTGVLLKSVHTSCKVVAVIVLVIVNTEEVVGVGEESGVGVV